MTNVTLCIPVYNGAPFLPRLLDSLLAQTHTAWEAIVVDDVSTDDSCDVVARYAARDSRIRLVRSEVNSGSANVPILRAMTLASTDWACVFGQDDWIEPDYLHKLVSRAEATDADIVVARMVMVGTDGHEIGSIPDSQFDTNQVLTGLEACRLTIGQWQIGANGMLCRTSYQRAMASEAGTEMNRDEVNTRKVFAMAGCVAFAPACYYYLIHQGSITRKVTPKLFDKLETNYALLCFVADTYPDDPALQALQWDACARDVKAAHYLFWQHKEQLADPAIAKRLQRAYEQLAPRYQAHCHDALGWLFRARSYRLYSAVLRLKYKLHARRNTSHQ